MSSLQFLRKCFDKSTENKLKEELKNKGRNQSMTEVVMHDRMHPFRTFTAKKGEKRTGTTSNISNKYFDYMNAKMQHFMNQVRKLYFRYLSSF